MITFDFNYKTLFLSFLFFCCIGFSKSFAQDDVILYVDSLGFTVDNMDPELYTFPIRVVNFDSIGGVDIILKVIGNDVTIVNFSLDPAVSPGLSSFLVQNDSVANGLFIPSDGFDSIDDNDIFLNLQLRLSGGEGACVELIFDFLEVIKDGAIVPSLGIGSQNLCVLTTANIVGEVVYANAAMSPVDSVLVSAADADSTYDAITDLNGNFAFADVPALTSYEIFALAKIDETDRASRLNGINIGDIITIIRHDIGLETFSSPYQYIAADINNDGEVSLLDIITLRDYLLFRIDEFENNTFWRFIDATYQFADPDNPLLESFPEFITTGDLTGDLEGLQFKAVKVGDADLNAY